MNLNKYKKQYLLLALLFLGINAMHAQISFPNGNIKNVFTNQDVIYIETQLKFNTGIYKSDDYRWVKISDSIDYRWLVSSCFNGECRTDLTPAGNFIKDFGINDSTCFIAFHVQSNDFDGKSTIQYWVINKKDMLDNATLIFNITYKNTTGIEDQTLALNHLSVYPNPAGASTYISYDLKKMTNVTIEVSNILGEVVQSIALENQGAGQHTTELNTSFLSPGIYIISVNGNKLKLQVSK